MVKIRKTQRGLTLLEYCAGAALVGMVAFAVIRAMGNGLTQAGTNIGNWAENQSNNLNVANVQGNGGTTTGNNGTTTGSGGSSGAVE